MSIYVIGDRDTVLGMRLVGAEGAVVRTLNEAREELDNAVQRSDLKLLFITRDWAQQMRERMERLKMTSFTPVVMEIPDRDVKPPEESVGELVRRAIGIRI